MTHDTRTLTTAPTDRRPGPTPTELGIGARFSLHPHRDDFVDVIVDALDAAQADDVEVTTDDVTTFVRGTEDAVVRYLFDALRAAAEAGGHLVAHVHLSRGCPGEVACDLPDDVVLATPPVPVLPRCGMPTAAHWSLYPLDDGAPGRQGDHMSAVTAAVDAAHRRVDVTPEHFVTRLDGDLADVLTTVVEGWLTAGRTVRHVATHATLVVASPSW
ncbi:YkoF family thiamine/hydroxymethylpyrimidine-binding protein [Cellulomonas sp. CW35]|uniref:Thiamin/hydroxymethyl pyrimidine-binding YkoF putative domain-containing protein n=1 Tax=Cellulomonas uda TaxID=1714 RepID=A0A4Y3K7U4_CELUD|nr:YkoF family thiamine/hydroxymethylpyrimidine-binding protein [Cellulomonas uda]NII65413.1 hypothetical protein [Cellulomonas uda]GEA80589.1 hypothetical protein CUD01_10330 [Cellulomonas uda]